MKTPSKQQVVLIHGGDTYDTYEEYLADLTESKQDADDFMDDQERRWRDRMHEVLGAGYEVFNPEMPNWMNAKYELWKIWFEKMLEYVHDGAIYVGHSLGGIFLAKYFAEKPMRIPGAIFLVSAPFAQRGEKGMADFILPDDLSKLVALGPKVHLYHSEDDPIVSFEDFEKYKKLLPTASARAFKKGGHFITTDFPELVAELRAIK